MPAGPIGAPVSIIVYALFMPLDASPPPTPISTSPHSLANRLGRVAWGVVQATLFRFSPRPLHGWRRFLLRLFGASVHPTAHVYPTARIWAPWNLTLHEHACAGDLTDLYCVAPITIGPRSTVSHYSFLCAASHDFEHPDHPLTTAPITLGANVWLAADVFVAPGVTIADGVVVGARSSVFSSLTEPWTLYAGSPARPVRRRVMPAAAHP